MNAGTLKDTDFPAAALAAVNEDGSTTKLVIAPLIVIGGAMLAIFVARRIQSAKEKSWGTSDVDQT